MAVIARPDAAALTQARVDLAAALRAAALYGFNEGIDNHFSLAVPGRDDLFLLNRYGPHWSEIQASDILAIDFDGRVVDGEGDWERSAFVIHRGVHQAHPDARAVFHTHMPWATAVATTSDGFDTKLSQAAMSFHGRVATIPYGGLATAEEEGGRIAAAISTGVSIVMMRNHGVLAVGPTVAAAWYALYFCERACQVQVLAQSTGRELVQVPDEIAESTARQWLNDSDVSSDRLFEAVKRQLDRDSPGYAD